MIAAPPQALGVTIAAQAHLAHRTLMRSRSDPAQRLDARRIGGGETGSV
jgi:hypothetical protein